VKETEAGQNKGKGVAGNKDGDRGMHEDKGGGKDEGIPSCLFEYVNK
jgi:hypothetical protein